MIDDTEDQWNMAALSTLMKNSTDPCKLAAAMLVCGASQLASSGGSVAAITCLEATKSRILSGAYGVILAPPAGHPRRGHAPKTCAVRKR